MYIGCGGVIVMLAKTANLISYTTIREPSNVVTTL